MLVGLDGHFIEIQARAVEVLATPRPLTEAATITGMATGAVRESLQRIGGAFAKLQIPKSDVEVLVNLAPADLPKYGTWLDLPLAVILLQAAGYLPDLPDHQEGDFVLMGEIGIHGEVRTRARCATRWPTGRSRGNPSSCPLATKRNAH